MRIIYHPVPTVFFSVLLIGETYRVGAEATIYQKIYAIDFQGSGCAAVSLETGVVCYPQAYTLVTPVKTELRVVNA